MEKLLTRCTFIKTTMDSLKGQGLDIRMGLECYGWRDLGQEMVRQLFIIF
jgi:hypothetical protein